LQQTMGGGVPSCNRVIRFRCQPYPPTSYEL
jgi:hypothetical protein